MNDDEIDSFLKEKTIKFDTMCCKVAAARVHGGIASKLRGRCGELTDVFSWRILADTAFYLSHTLSR